MPSEVEVRRAVQTWAAAVLGYTPGSEEAFRRVRPGPSNGVVGDEAYLTVEVRASEEEWATEVTRSDGAGTAIDVTPVSTQALTVELSGYGEGCTEQLRRLAMWWTVKEPRSDTLRDAGVHPSSPGPVRRIPVVLETAWYERATVSLTCYADLTDDPAERTSAATVTITVEDLDDTVSATVTVSTE